MKKQYEHMSDAEKQDLINNQYIIEKKSFIDIATEYDTYPNKIRRDAQKFNISIRSKRDAQKNALETGKHKHPTKGMKRSEETKTKIGLSVMNVWDTMDQETKDIRRQKAKNQWDSLSDEEKQNLISLANEAVRSASKEGSKLEKFILEFLLKNNHRVDFHKEHILSNTKLQLDLFLPKHNIVIEVDGPSHFEPVWGEEALKRNQKYDNKKNGLIIGKGLKLIRIKQVKDFSKSRALVICDNLLNKIDQMINDKTNTTNYIEIGD
jgi:very-short-patch-repair endonuclease